METIKKAIKHCGSRLAFARAIKSTPVQPYLWAKDSAFPSKKSAYAIEEATNGIVTAKEILIEIQKIKLKRLIEQDIEDFVAETLGEGKEWKGTMKGRKGQRS